MEDQNDAIRELHQKIEELARKHKSVYEEIQQLQNAVFKLELGERPSINVQAKPVERVEKVEPTLVVPEPRVAAPEILKPRTVQTAPDAKTPTPEPPRKPITKKEPTPLEEFIGTNLLNKIGIAVLVVGIGFGAKYSIDHQLLSPLTRIILGYVCGVGLVMVALKLKKNHENFSAVLLSGGMAVFYFLTYAAYDFYDLIPQGMAFILMVLFTGFTVFAAIQYNREVIGIIGLVGAYAVPFLLSDGSGKVIVLFSYMTIINAGILVLAFKKYWKRLYYLAFSLTWLAFSAWHIDQFDVEKHLPISLVFSTIFFLTFYATFLSYKLIRKEALSPFDLAFMLLNSFIFYGFGYFSIEMLEGGDEYLGLFTLATAVIHFVACLIVFKQQSQFKDIFYFIAGMVLVFLTLAVPVQLEGNWVTLVWAMEAALIFWIGRTKQFPVYEKLSYPLILLASGSLIQDWGNTYTIDYYYSDVVQEHIPFLLNIQFLTTVLVAASFGFILFTGWKEKFPAPFKNPMNANQWIIGGVAGLLLFVLYAGIFAEVDLFWSQKYQASKIPLPTNEYGDNYFQYDQDLLRYNTLWLIYYSAIFALVISVVQLRFIKHKNFELFSAGANLMVIGAFLLVGIYELSMLRSSYLTDSNNPFYFRDFQHIFVRYIGLLLMAGLLLVNYLYAKKDHINLVVRQTERVLFHCATLILLSSELVHWLEMSRIENSFKLGLSILWGVYALFLIIVGLMKNLGHIRILAIVIFGVTLVKLFIYDMADMSTISKTIVMMILGVLLLTASFLYNKIKRSTPNEPS